MAMETREDSFEGAESPVPKHSWLDDTLRQFNFVALMRERNQVKQTCAEALKAYRQFEAAAPTSTNTWRYERVVATLTGADENGVRTVLRRAEQSFASWPVDRDLVFRDVVAFIAITNCLRADIAHAGVRSRVMDVVANSIPKNL
jgi:hypothetical protein